MTRLELTEPEAELLRELAEEWLSELRAEIAGTDNADYRQGLKRRESLVRAIVERLSSPVTAPSR